MNNRTKSCLVVCEVGWCTCAAKHDLGSPLQYLCGSLMLFYNYKLSLSSKKKHSPFLVVIQVGLQQGNTLIIYLSTSNREINRCFLISHPQA